MQDDSWEAGTAPDKDMSKNMSKFWCKRWNPHLTSDHELLAKTSPGNDPAKWSPTRRHDMGMGTTISLVWPHMVPPIPALRSNSEIQGAIMKKIINIVLRPLKQREKMEHLQRSARNLQLDRWPTRKGPVDAVDHSLISHGFSEIVPHFQSVWSLFPAWYRTRTWKSHGNVHDFPAAGNQTAESWVQPNGHAAIPRVTHPQVLWDFGRAFFCLADVAKIDVTKEIWKKRKSNRNNIAMEWEGMKPNLVAESSDSKMSDHVPAATQRKKYTSNTTVWQALFHHCSENCNKLWNWTVGFPPFWIILINQDRTGASCPATWNWQARLTSNIFLFIHHKTRPGTISIAIVVMKIPPTFFMDISKSSLYQMFCTTTQGGQVNQKRDYKDQYWAFTTPRSGIAACRKRENKQPDSSARDEPWSGRSKQERRLERAQMRARDGTRERRMGLEGTGWTRERRMDQRSGWTCLSGPVSGKSYSLLRLFKLSMSQKKCSLRGSGNSSKLQLTRKQNSRFLSKK